MVDEYESFEELFPTNASQQKKKIAQRTEHSPTG
jgi:hypothetical protein